MKTVIEIGKELFDVHGRAQPDGSVSYEFSWTNGPAGGTYGFVVGGIELDREALEREARGFVQSFFAPDGIGSTDFPEFVEYRKSSGF